MLKINGTHRRGVAFAFVAVGSVALLGMAALTIDVGLMYRARAEAQMSADAAALAAATRLLDDDALAGAPNMTQEIAAAKSTASTYAAKNPVMNDGPALDVSTDVQVGTLSNPWNPDEPLSFVDPTSFNTVHVVVRRDAERNGPIALAFAGILGHTSADVSADAAAIFRSDITGIDPRPGQNAGALPFTLQVDVWNDLLNGGPNAGDNYAWNEGSTTVSSGGDGIFELNIYPGAGVAALPPGNFGTIDIGGAGNSTSDIARQILHGISEQDIADLGQDFVLGPDGQIILNGDTGLSAGLKDELTAIIGEPRILPLFSTVTGNGNNSMYTIVGFAGVRIMNVKLTGSQSSKRVIIQPSFVVDPTVVVASPGNPPGGGDFVYKPVELVR